MPIAAVPSYLPDKLLADASPGLRFGMYLTLWGIDQRSREPLWGTHDIVYRVSGREGRERSFQEENKRSALDMACKLTPSDRRTMTALAQRQNTLAEPLAKSGALVILEAIAVAPFTTGLGNEHPLENGFALLNHTGSPTCRAAGSRAWLDRRHVNWRQASGTRRAAGTATRFTLSKLGRTK